MQVIVENSLKIARVFRWVSAIWKNFQILQGGGQTYGRALNIATLCKKINKHRITTSKVDETPSLQQVFLTLWFERLH